MEFDEKIINGYGVQPVAILGHIKAWQGNGDFDNGMECHPEGFAFSEMV